MVDGSHHKSVQKFAGSLNHAMLESNEALAAQTYVNDFGKPGFQDVTRCYIQQRYEGYTPENQETWQTLFDRQMEFLSKNASQTYLSGAKKINLSRDRVPPLSDINARLKPMTGWQSRAVAGYLPSKVFFACLARRDFPTTVVIRPKESIDYLPEPDIFHDVFGHVPLHADPTFADFLQTYGQAALTTDDPAETERLARLFWFTVEFGLIREGGTVKVYGSGLISSPGESRHSLSSDSVDRRPFNLEQVCDTAFEIDHFQPILYVLDSFDQLRDAMNTYSKRLLSKKGSPVPA